MTFQWRPFCLTFVSILKIAISVSLALLLINGYIGQYENDHELTRNATEPIDPRGPWQNATTPLSTEIIPSLREQSQLKPHSKSVKPLLYFLCSMHFISAFTQLNRSSDALSSMELHKEFKNAVLTMIVTFIFYAIVFVERFVPSLVECYAMSVFFSLDYIRFIFLFITESAQFIYFGHFV